MPTGYTAAVQDGSITELAPFALQCARAFGALVMMRDEPSNAAIPEEFAPTDFHAQSLEKAMAKQSMLLAMTPDEAATAALSDFTAKVAYRAEDHAKRQQHMERYTAMMIKVITWKAPTPDHEPMRNFMIKQLEESIDFDCSDVYEGRPPAEQVGEEWLAERLECAVRDIDYHTEKHAAELKRNAERNAWVKALRESLAALPES